MSRLITTLTITAAILMTMAILGIFPDSLGVFALLLGVLAVALDEDRKRQLQERGQDSLSRKRSLLRRREEEENILRGMHAERIRKAMERKFEEMGV